MSDGELYFDSVGKVILPTLGLHALSLVFISILIYLVTIVTKNKMTALFVSTVALLSGIILPLLLAPVSKIAHLIPTTYVRSFDITTGVFQHTIENYKVNTGLGVLVLLASSLILLATFSSFKEKENAWKLLRGCKWTSFGLIPLILTNCLHIAQAVFFIFLERYLNKEKVLSYCETLD